MKWISICLKGEIKMIKLQYRLFAMFRIQYSVQNTISKISPKKLYNAEIQYLTPQYYLLKSPGLFPFIFLKARYMAERELNPDS